MSKRKLDQINEPHLAAPNQWWNTMQLLGFDPKRAEERYKVTFEQQMFASRARRNTKGMLAIFVFLFKKLNPKDREFSSYIWELNDLSGKREAENILSRKLHDLESSKILPEGSIKKALLVNPYGPRFYDLLYNISTYVLKREVLKVLPKTERPELEDPNRLTRAQLTEYENHLERVTAETQSTFLSKAHQAHRVEQTWRTSAGEMVPEIERLELLEEMLIRKCEEIGSKPPPLENCEWKLKQAEEKWGDIDVIHANYRAYKETIETCTSSTTNVFRLSASDFRAQPTNVPSSNSKGEVRSEVDLSDVCEEWSSSLEEITHTMQEYYDDNESPSVGSGSQTRFQASLREVSDAFKSRPSVEKKLSDIKRVNTKYEQKNPLLKKEIDAIGERVDAKIPKEDIVTQQDCQLQSIHPIEDICPRTFTLKVPDTNLPDTSLGELTQKLEDSTLNSLRGKKHTLHDDRDLNALLNKKPKSFPSTPSILLLQAKPQSFERRPQTRQFQAVSSSSSQRQIPQTQIVSPSSKDFQCYDIDEIMDDAQDLSEGLLTDNELANLDKELKRKF